MYNDMPVFDYEDIQLVPNKCIISSRSEADTSVKLGNYTFKLPVIPANMQTIIDESIAEELAEKCYFYIMHRFEEDKRQPFIKRMHDKGLIASISVGVKHYEYDFVSSLKNDQPEFITIDIAHGHSDSVINMIKHIKKELPETFVIAGNVGTPEAVRELENAGADATKVGIGPGKVCITKVKTGFGTGGWQLAALRWCAKAARKPIIADGGIRTHGDIAKSIRFGATMVMIGSLFAGHIESPGKQWKSMVKPLKNTMVQHLNTKKVNTKTLKVKKFCYRQRSFRRYLNRDATGSSKFYLLRWRKRHSKFNSC